MRTETAHLPLAEGTDDLARLTPEALAHTIPSRLVGEGQGGGSVFSFVRTHAIPLQLTAVSAFITLAAIVRFRGLPGTGPVAYDEGWAPANGRFLVTFLTHPGEWAGLLHRQFHLFVFGNDGKIAHDLALGSLLAAGVSPDNLTWYPALAGIVMAVVLAALAWRRWGAAAAAVAGVFGAAVPLSVIYGHLLAAEADSLAALSVLLYLLDRWWDRRPSLRLMALTLLAFVATLTLNYRLAPVLLALALVAGYLGLRSRGRLHHLRPSSAWLITLCLMPALAMTAAYLLVLVADVFHVHVPAAVHHLLRSGGAPVPFAFPDFYPRTLWDFAGPVAVIVTAIAIVVLLWNRRRLDPLAATAIGGLLGSILFFSAVHDKAPRAMAVCVPFAALVVARAVSLPLPPPPLRGRVGVGGLQWMVAGLICAAVLVSGWTSQATQAISGTGQAGRWLAERPGTIVASRAPVFTLYTERNWDLVAGPTRAHAMAPLTTSSTIASLRQEGARWVVVDAHGLLIEQSPAFRQLIACGTPSAEFNDSASWAPRPFLEEADTLHLDYGGILRLRDQLLASVGGAQTIRIYDLTGAGTAGCQ